MSGFGFGETQLLSLAYVLSLRSVDAGLRFVIGGVGYIAHCVSDCLAVTLAHSEGYSERCIGHSSAAVPVEMAIAKVCVSM